jgi:hypothetical protein
VRRTLISVAAFTVVALCLAGPAAAQQNYPITGEIQLSDASIDCPSGQELTITGEGFLPNEPAVRIFFDGQEIARVFPNAQGEFSVNIDPPGAGAGQHTIEARQFVSAEEPDEIVASATLTCVGAGVAFTGADVSWGVALVATLLVIGAVALVAGRRRAQRAA